MNYSTLQSAYLRERLTSTPWKNRAIIDDLVILHRYVQKGGAGNFAGALQYHSLQQRYPQEYLALLQEHSPDGYRARLQQTAAAQDAHWRHSIVAKEAALSALKATREDWLRAGGGG